MVGNWARNQRNDQRLRYIESVTKEAKIINIYSALESRRVISSIFFPGSFGKRIDLTENQHTIQASVINIANGAEIKAHRHLNQLRETHRTQEVWIIQEGFAKIAIYDIDDTFICHQEVTVGCIVVLLDGGHGIESLTPNLILAEIKNGPYRGSRADKLSI